MKLTKRSIALLAGAVLALVAFFMVFADGLKNVSWQHTYFGWKVAGVTVLNANIVSLLGFVAALAAGVLLCLLVLGKLAEKRRLIVIIAVALLAVGALLMFLTAALSKAFTSGAQGLELGIGPIMGGILALLAAAAAAVGEFVLKE